MSIAAAKGMTAKQAVGKALEYFREFFSDQVVENVLLEELEFDESDRNWRVTIGFDIGSSRANTYQRGTPFCLGRQQRRSRQDE
jgi:hypothetical protein